MPLPPPLPPRSAPPKRRFPWSVGLGGLIVLLAAFQLLRPYLQRPGGMPPTTPPPEHSSPAAPELPAPPVATDTAANQVYTRVDQMPQPPGGMNGLMRYLSQNIHYPDEALRQAVEGKVFVNFTIGPDGLARNVQVLRGIGAGCDAEAVRVIRRMPPWTPGRQRGRLVSVSYTVPITFSIAKPSFQSLFKRLFQS